MRTAVENRPMAPRHAQGMNVSLFDIVMGMGKAVDWLDSALADHHARVACVAESIAAEVGLSAQDRTHVLCAGLLHDIGAFSVKDRLEFLKFDLEGAEAHAEMGHRLVGSVGPLEQAAKLIRFHHTPWGDGRGHERVGDEVPFGSHVLHLADRATVGVKSGKEVLSQVEGIMKLILDRKGKVFKPDLVEAFRSLAAKEAFWFEVTSPEIGSVLADRSVAGISRMQPTDLEGMSELFCKIIDFRSRFTATHSRGVAAAAERLSAVAGLSAEECGTMKLAGYLHDIGKLAIPIEILDKPGALTREEWNVVKRHPFLTHRIIKGMGGLETVASWASQHHERLDGLGYPFHLKGEEIPLGARILSVADVFTALAEDRPYRKALPQESVLRILLDMARESCLDPEVATLLADNYEEINFVRQMKQERAKDEYRVFLQG
ncbi:MAG: HD domain-containing phosphohydrolase [Thermodesulfobacteriota bacterium]